MKLSNYFLAIFLYLFTINFAEVSEAAKILAVFPVPTHSHFTLMFRIAKELADRGHQVTGINPYPLQEEVRNYVDVPVPELVEYVKGIREKLFDWDKLGPISNLNSINDMGAGLCEQLYLNRNVQQLLRSNATFDVVLMEHFSNEAMLGIAHRFKAPTILLSPMGVNLYNHHIFAIPAPASYIPSVIGPFTKQMSFLERLQNFVTVHMAAIVRELYHLPRQREIFDRFYPNSGVSLDDLLYNVSLLLSNSHVSYQDAVPRVPQVIEIGGYHVKQPGKLSEDLQEFMDRAKDGVVIFSMGSNLDSKDLKPQVREAILNSFAKIKAQVLWKFEDPDLSNKPPNVKIIKWLPQQDILAHPNVRLFITHGGLLSTIETIYHGVPIIGIPVFGDQKGNIASAVRNGYALSVPLQTFNEEDFSWALNEVLDDPKYREEARTRSKLMHDQPLRPIDMAVFWIEFVVRHKGGGGYLKSEGVRLGWFKRETVDVVLVLLGGILGGGFVVCGVAGKVMGWGKVRTDGGKKRD